MKHIFLFSILMSLLILVFVPVRSQVSLDSTLVDTSTVVTGLDTPWEILWGPDDHIWITERAGRISRLHPGTGVVTELITIPGVYEQSESGLLGMVLHPGFPEQPYLFLVYNYLDNNDIKERLVRYTYSDLSLVSPDTLLEGIEGRTVHNGSRLVIDDDMKLYMTTGDAGNTSNSQDTASLNGKILRMNLDGTVPGDNPFPGSLVWTLGHRNPQGLVISPEGIIYSSEHGPASDDEVNIIEKGRNYGWPLVEGYCDGAAEIPDCEELQVKEPITAWTPTLAVAGTEFYSHPAIPEWQNSLLVTSLKAKTLVSLKLSGDGMSVTEENLHFSNWFGRLRDMCISPDGRVFLAVSNRDGRGTVQPGDDRIVEIAPVKQQNICYSSLEVTICPDETFNFNGTEIGEPGTYTDTVTSPSCDTIITLNLVLHLPEDLDLPDTVRLNTGESTTLIANQSFVEYSWNGQAPVTENTLELSGSDLGEGTFTVTLEAVDGEGCRQSGSVVIVVEAVTGIPLSGKSTLRAYPNPVHGNLVHLEYQARQESELVVYDQLGREITRQILPGGTGQVRVMLPGPAGLYYLRISGKDPGAGVSILKL